MDRVEGAWGLAVPLDLQLAQTPQKGWAGGCPPFLGRGAAVKDTRVFDTEWI